MIKHLKNIIFGFLLLNVAIATQAQVIMFDDFNYSGVNDPQLSAFNKWDVIDGVSGPPEGAVYSKNNVEFIVDPSNSANKIMTLKTTVNGQTKAITNSRIETSDYSYFEGTYAARIYLSDEAFTSKDANIQTFYTIVSSSLAQDGTKYSEMDIIEYMAADKWGTSNDNRVGYTTSYHKYIADPWTAWKTYVTQQKSLAGWHTFIASCTDKVNIKYYMDDIYLGAQSVTDNETQAGLSVYPRSNMQVAFANWIWNDVLGTSTSNRTNTLKADWVLYYKNVALSLTEVNNLVTTYRSQGLQRRNLAGQTYTNTVTPPNNPSTTGLVTPYNDCNYAGFSAGLSIGDYNLAALTAKGINDNVISSLKITQGYKAILFDGDNFTGASTTITSSNSCLDGTWNDKISSIQIRANGATNLAGTYAVQNRFSGLVMDVWGLSTADGGNIAQGTANGGANQQFTFDHLGDGVYKITSVNSGKVVDISGVSTENGANVHQWTYGGGANQQFIAVATDSGYYKLIAKHSGKLVEVAGFSTASGGNIQQWENANQGTGEWKLNTITTSTFTKLIQAEDYNNMSGIQTEATTDTGGGLNVGYADNGDWMAYNSITFPTTGSYLVEYRVASLNGGAKISLDLNAGSIQLGAVNVGATGGWQNWTTVSHTVTITAGTYNLGVFFAIGGVNLNWVKITKVGAARGVEETAVVAEDTTFTVNIYPNPADSNLFFTADVTGANVSVITPMGSTLSNMKITNNSVDVSNLESGIYMAVIEKNGKKTVQRFVKK